MNRNLLLVLGAFLAVVIVAGVLLLAKPKTQNTQGMPLLESTKTEERIVEEGVGSTPEDEVREITISGNEYSFNPSSISLSKGEKVRLTFVNVGSMPHNLLIDELGVSTKTMARGKSDTVEFVVEKTGTFSFYCNISNHRSLGMEGEVKVE